jgi:hypothetical protein
VLFLVKSENWAKTAGEKTEDRILEYGLGCAVGREEEEREKMNNFALLPTLNEETGPPQC